MYKHRVESHLLEMHSFQTSPTCKTDIQNNHSMMCFKHQMYFSILAGTCGLAFPWAIPMQEDHFPPTFPTELCAVQDITEVPQYVGHFHLSLGAGMSCPSLKRGSRYLFHMMSSNIMLHEGTSRLPLFSKVIRTDSTAHSFSQTAEWEGITISCRYPCWFNSARSAASHLCAAKRGKELEKKIQKWVLLLREAPAILFALDTTEILNCYKSLLWLHFIPLIGLIAQKWELLLAYETWIVCLTWASI